MSPLSKEGKWILSALCFLIVIALILPSESEDAKVTLANSEQVPAKKKETAEHSENNNLEITGLRVASENIEIKNPFRYSHETTSGKTSYDADKDKKVSPRLNPPFTNEIPKSNATQTVDKVSPTWKLKGTVTGKSGKTAILSDENKSVTVQIGDTFDNKTVTAIEDDYIDYLCDSEKGRLWLSP